MGHIQAAQQARVDAAVARRDRDRRRVFLQSSQDLIGTTILPRDRALDMLGQYKGEEWADRMLEGLEP